jgi:probable HAF family extracellular repeat protein
LGFEAFRWTSSGGMVGLGDLAGGSFLSAATAVSADGSVVVGQGVSASGAEAFRWTSGGGMVGLGDLAGGSFFSVALAVSANGSVVVGQGTTASEVEAFVWDATGGMQSLTDVLSPSVGAALDGWTLSVANAISADGRTVVGQGTNPNGDTEAWLAYLADETHWFAETSGAWDSVLSWSGPFVPGPADDVVIDPTAALTVTGPGTSRTVNSLTLGGSGVGRVSLELASSGDLNVATYLYNETNGDLVLADGAIVSAQVLYNSGLVRGSGTVNADLVNYADAETRVASGESLVVSGLSHSNAGRLEVIDGSLELIGAVINDASTGLITGRDATLRFNHGVTNDGAIALSFGTSDVFGDIDNTATGEVVISGGAAVTFYDDVVQNGTLRVSSVGSTTSVAVFLGDFTGAGGTTGGGDIFFEGDLRPGNSPATVTLDNNVALGSGASLQIELGGLNPGSEYDQFFVTGDLSLDGLLEVSILPGFTPAAGQSFDILDWGSLSGTFAAINLPTLAGLSWNTSQLYMTGVLSVAAAGLLGDYNGNGTIDAADYTVWRDALTAGATSLLNDSTPGTVEESDFLYWRTHFGESLGSGAGGVSAAAAVPEPNTLVLLVLGGLLGLAARRHGRR